jgi:N-acetylglutamate synthase-like GNAT family acetyltransferase
MLITIRPAVESDQSTIISFIHQAKINPRNLRWQRFLVTEENGKIVGIRQVKMHKQGTREVASGFVLPKYRRRGISVQLMNEILSRESGTLYLMCRDIRALYYEKFGFQKVDSKGLPSNFHKEYRIGRIITTLGSILTKDRVRIIPMKRE